MAHVPCKHNIGWWHMHVLLEFMYKCESKNKIVTQMTPAFRHITFTNMRSILFSHCSFRKQKPWRRRFEYYYRWKKWGKKMLLYTTVHFMKTRQLNYGTMAAGTLRAFYTSRKEFSTYTFSMQFFLCTFYFFF